jgi:hypothetical protein
MAGDAAAGSGEPDPHGRVRAEEVPAAVVDAARASYLWLDTGADVAVLIRDRTAEDPTMVFATSGLTVEVTTEVATGRIGGRIRPPQTARVEVQRPSGTVAAAAVGDDGRFAAVVEGDGPLRLSLDCEARVVVTSWFLA